MNSDDMPQDPLIGTRVAGYLISAFLGRGGVGVVYLAEDERLGRNVALKLLSPEFVGDEEARRRFVRESKMAAALDHPNIVPVYDAGESDETLYIAMRHVGGPNLGAMISGGGLTLNRSLNLIGQVAHALDAAHAAGLVHRDVKPSNILVDIAAGAGRQDHAYLGDFGLTRRGADRTSITQEGTFLGTVEFASPEQLHGLATDGRSDQYSLACVLYACIAGRSPFLRPTVIATFMAHLEDPPLSFASVDPALHRLDALFGRALDKDPSTRYSSCGEFVAEVRLAIGDGAVAKSAISKDQPTVIASSGLAAGRPAKVSTSAPPDAASSRGVRRRVAAIALTVLVLATGGSAAFLLRHPASDRPVLTAAPRAFGESGDQSGSHRFGDPAGPIVGRRLSQFPGTMARATLVGDRIYVPEGFGDRIRAHDARTGTLVWELAGPAGCVPLDGASRVVGRGTLVVWTLTCIEPGTKDPATGEPRARSTLTAADGASGEKLWEFVVADGSMTQALILEKAVVVGARWSQYSALYFLDPKTGKERPSERNRSDQTLKIPGRAFEIVTDESVIYLRLRDGFETTSGSIYAINIEDRTQRWATRIEGEVAGIAAYREHLFLTSGDLVNILNASDGTVRSERAARVNAGPAAVSDMAIYATMDGVVAVDPRTGNEVWSEPIDSSFGSSPVAAGRYVFVMDGAAGLYVFEPHSERKRIGSYQLSFVTQSPLIGSDFIALVSQESITVYELKAARDS